MHTKCNGINIYTFIDNGADANFISKRFVQLHKLPTNRKRYPYTTITLTNQHIGENDGEISYETTVTLEVRGQTKTITLNILNLAQYDIVLGDPWLVKHNLLIDWRTRNIIFDRYEPNNDGIAENI